MAKAAKMAKVFKAAKLATLPRARLNSRCSSSARWA